MPRTRSSIARAAPKPHKLPTDILTRVAAFACDDELARLALSAKSALAALDNRQIWAATLRTNHGGLRIRAEPSGLQGGRAPRLGAHEQGPGLRLPRARVGRDVLEQRCVLGRRHVPARALRVFYSATVGGERLLCAATFLTGGDSDPDRQWMIDTLREYVKSRAPGANVSLFPGSPWRLSSAKLRFYQIP